jgi:hypothetical protein
MQRAWFWTPALLTAGLVCLLSGCHSSSAHSVGNLPASPAATTASRSGGPPGSRTPIPATAELVTPPAPPSSGCGQYGLVAETSTSYTYLLDCSGGTLSAPPRLHLGLGSRLAVAGALANAARVHLIASSPAIHLSGMTAVGVSAGTAVVSVTGISCFAETANEATGCPLFSVTVS